MGATVGREASHFALFLLAILKVATVKYEKHQVISSGN